MALLGAALVRRAEADGGAAGDQRRPVGHLGRFDRRGNRRRIVTVDPRRRPAGRLEALHLVNGIGKRQRTVDRDAVVVEQHDEFFQLEVPGKRDRLLTDAFHQIAVGGEHVGSVIDDVVAEQGGEVTLGDRHADRIGKALAERTGRRLDAGRMVIFRMAGRERADLPEALDLIDRHRLVAEQMKERIKQHRAVTGREHEAVAIGPGRIGRIEFQEAREQHGGDVGGAHRQARVTGLRLLDGVHRQRANRIRHAVVLGAGGRTRGCGGKAGRLGEGCARREDAVRHRHGTGQARPIC